MFHYTGIEGAAFPNTGGTLKGANWRNNNIYLIFSIKKFLNFSLGATVQLVEFRPEDYLNSRRLQ